MNSHLVVLASLGAAVLLSPEILVLGLIAASDRGRPRSCALAFAAGTAAGLALATAVGFAIGVGPSHPAAPPSWFGVWIRAAIAVALLTIGCWRAYHAWRDDPIPMADDAEAKPAKPGRMARFLSPDAPPRRRMAAAFGMGFIATGPNPKVFPVAIAAAHQAQQLAGGERVLGLAIAAAIALVPGVLPLAIETARPGSSARIKDGVERFMKTKGRWAAAAILIGAGVFVGVHAWKGRPGAAAPTPGVPQPAASIDGSRT